MNESAQSAKEPVAPDTKCPPSPRPSARAKEPKTLPPDIPRPGFITNRLMPELMRLAACPGGTIDTETMNAYREDVANDKELERALVDQVAMGRLMILDLYDRYARAQTVTAAGIFIAAAARLEGELRRTILAIQQFRNPASQTQPVTIQQQNVAHKQEVIFAGSQDGDITMQCRDRNQPDGEIGSNDDEKRHKTEIPGPRFGRYTEPAVAAADHG